MLAGALAVEGAGLENRRTGVLSHIAGSNFAYSFKTIRNSVCLFLFLVVINVHLVNAKHVHSVFVINRRSKYSR